MGGRDQCIDRYIGRHLIKIFSLMLIKYVKMHHLFLFRPNPLKITLQSVRHTYIMTLIMTLLRQLCKRQLVLPLSSQECYLCWHLLIGMKHQNTLVGQPRTAIENCPVKLTEVEHRVNSLNHLRFSSLTILFAIALFIASSLSSI